MKHFPRVLIVEDESAIAELIAVNLRHNGFQPTWAMDSETAQRELDAVLPDVILLDWMLPGESGLSLAKKWRKDARTKGVPILMLTARGDEADRVAGLDAGADDYITKPFSPQELIARIKALFRRQQAMGQAQTDGQIQAHGLTIDPLARSVLLHGQVVDLTPREFELLYFFARHPGEVFSRLALLEQVWGPEYADYVYYPRVYISQLRRKIEPDPKLPSMIVTVRGDGYEFTQAVETG